jgi:hypothetical protein
VARSLPARAPRGALGGVCLLLAAAALLLTARPADAATINGPCSATAASFTSGVDPDDPASLAIDVIEIPENSSVDNGTEGNPFGLDSQGSVAWSGQTSMAATNHSWSVDFLVAGVGSLDDSDPNAEDERTDSGVKDMADIFPADVTGLVKVDGTFASDGGTCTGDGWIKLIGSPTGTIPWIGGLVAGAIGLLGLAFATPKAIPSAAAMVPEASAGGADAAAPMPTPGPPSVEPSIDGPTTDGPTTDGPGSISPPHVPEPPPDPPVGPGEGTT